jgi:hypothetical protein
LAFLSGTFLFVLHFSLYERNAKNRQILSLVGIFAPPGEKYLWKKLSTLLPQAIDGAFGL